MHAVCLDEADEALDAAGTAGAETAPKRDVRHAEAPCHRWECDGVGGVEEVDVGYDAVRSSERECLREAFAAAAGDDDLVDLAMVELENLFDDVAFLVADDVGGAVFLGQRDAVRTRFRCGW